MRRPSRLYLVQLEDRTTPASLYTVTGASDGPSVPDDVITLREALLAQRGDLSLSAGELAHVTPNAPGTSSTSTAPLPGRQSL